MARKRQVGSGHLDSVLPFIAIEEDKLILEDGRVCILFEVEGHELEALSGEEHRAFNQMLTGAISSLPPGTILQKLDVYYQKDFTGDQKAKGYFERKDFEYLYFRPIMKHRCFLCFSFGHRNQPKPDAVSSGRNLLKNPLNRIERRMGLAEQLGFELMHQLGGNGISFKRLEDKALREVCYGYFNLSFDPEHSPTAFECQISPAISGLGIGNKKVQVISAVGQGAVVDHHMKHKRGVDNAYLYPLAFELDFPHILSTTIRIENREKVLKSLDLEKRLTGSLGPLAGQDAMIRSEEIDLFTGEVRANNLSLVSLNISLILWESSEEKLRRNVDRSIAGFRQMNGAECLVEGRDTMTLFMANTPGNGFQNYRWLLMKTENAACYFSFATLQRSETEGIRLCDIHGNPVRVRLFNTDLNNQNALIIGPSGSGKSFTIGSFIIQRFEQGHRQIVIDNGGTYKTAITALNGKYFEIDPENPLRFNPFLVPKDASGHYQLSTEKLLFLTSLLSLLWKGADGKISQTERSVFAELIPAFYAQMDRGETPSLAWFYMFLQITLEDESFAQHYEHFNALELILNLKPFAEGEYKEILGSSDTVDLSDYPLIAFDLAGVKSNPQLYPIIALILIELTMENIRKYPDAKKFIYADEAWSFLSEGMGNFLESMYRTLRKNNASIAILTQGISEIINSPVGEAIIANADTRMVLYHTDPSQIAKVSKKLGFTRHEEDKLRSLRVFEDRRDVGIKQGDYMRVYSLEVSPAMRAVLSSKPEERNHLQKLIIEKESLRAGLNQYLEDIGRKETSYA